MNAHTPNVFGRLDIRKLIVNRFFGDLTFDAEIFFMIHHIRNILPSKRYVIKRWDLRKKIIMRRIVRKILNIWPTCKISQTVTPHFSPWFQLTKFRLLPRCLSCPAKKIEERKTPHCGKTRQIQLLKIKNVGILDHNFNFILSIKFDLHDLKIVAILMRKLYKIVTKCVFTLAENVSWP